MKNDYKATKEWYEDLIDLIETEPSLGKIRHWEIGRASCRERV